VYNESVQTLKITSIIDQIRDFERLIGLIVYIANQPLKKYLF
jgi:hypothetical protein